MSDMPEIEAVALTAIDPNPYRDLGRYPWVERKVEQLKRSIADVGFWEGVIARPHGERFQTAFGHHRIEAGRRLGLATVPLIVRPLTDEQMLAFMGRENGEDYGTDLLVMLNAWEGAVEFLSSGGAPPKPLAVAALLGWTTRHSDGGQTMTDVGKACSGAFTLIRDGQMARSEFAGLSVAAAHRVVSAAAHRMEMADKLMRANNIAAHKIEATKKHIGKAATLTIKDYQDGKIAHRDLRVQLDLHTYRFAREAQRRTPLFEAASDTLLRQIEGVLNGDNAEKKLMEIHKALANITENEDWQAVQRVGLALKQLSDRAGDWHRKLTDPRRAKRRT
jgi:hypothetical protein